MEKNSKYIEIYKDNLGLCKNVVAFQTMQEILIIMKLAHFSPVACMNLYAAVFVDQLNFLSEFYSIFVLRIIRYVRVLYHFPTSLETECSTNFV